MKMSIAWAQIANYWRKIEIDQDAGRSAKSNYDVEFPYFTDRRNAIEINSFRPGEPSRNELSPPSVRALPNRA
ncbi:hypothetical protein AB0I53_05535 [Saccharopolyspora sp. NPDC050389]|uniref:hypothetical protein n=1 Tax=Saccharopolyspora sp. NPDC050389 TaxID=3155516 RepID=UPI0033F6FC14